MVGNLLGELVLIGLTLFFAWLAWRAFRSKRPLVKWGGGLLAVIPTLLFGLISVVAGIGLVKIYVPLSRPVPAIKVAGTPDRIARGEHLAQAVCAACHSANGELPLTGGADLSKDTPVPVGSLYPYNLTPGGPLASWSDGEIFRALRDGVNQNGRPLAMPVARLRNLSDDDLQSVIAYLRSQPAVQNAVPESSPSLILALFMGAGLTGAVPSDLSPIQKPIVAPAKAVTPEYGEYIINFNDCRDCHRADLKGNPTQGLYPVTPNIPAFAQAWTREEFIKTMRTGTDPSGHAIKPPMPWKFLGRLDDVELSAVYQYLRSLQ
jgi:mono/diheme cytochrome c family protein